MLNDPKLVLRLRNPEETLAWISPQLLFAVLLRQVRRDLERRSYVYEIGSRGRRLPVFEASDTVGLLSKKSVLNYLVEVLCSFVRTNTGLIYWKESGTWHRRKFSDIDLEDMIDLASLVERNLKPAYFKRIGDIALFWSGIYPDRTESSMSRRETLRPRRRSLSDFEEIGSRFYRLAAREIEGPELRPILRALGEKFAVARRALHTLSDQYLEEERGRFFE